MNKLITIIVVTTFVVWVCACGNNAPTELKKEKIQKYMSTNHSDEFVLKIRIHAGLPIGWGAMYKCSVVETLSGTAPPLDTNFPMGMGMDGKHFDDKIFSLPKGLYIVGFYNGKMVSETDYLPSGTSGIMDTANNIWLISSFKKASQSLEEDVLDLVRMDQSGQGVSSRSIAEQLDIPRRDVEHLLDSLFKKNLVDRVKVEVTEKGKPSYGDLLYSSN